MKLKTIFSVSCLLVCMSVFGQNDNDAGGNNDATEPMPSDPSTGIVNVPRGPNVLWDQSTNPGGNGFPAQNFEAAFDAFDCRTADDFEVPAGVSWDITQVYFIGTLSTGGPVSTASVTFFNDAAGAPGSEIVSYNNIAVTFDGTGLVANVPTTNITSGIYWVAVDANLDFGTNGQFFWSARTAPTLGDSHFINPADGFGSGCITWTPTPTCGVGGGLSDALFQVSGTEVACTIDSCSLGTSTGGTVNVSLTGACPDGIGIYAATPTGTVQVAATVVVNGSTTVTVAFYADSTYFLSDDGGATVLMVCGSTVPTLGTWGLIAFIALLAGAAMVLMRKRARASQA